MSVVVAVSFWVQRLSVTEEPSVEDIPTIDIYICL